MKTKFKAWDILSYTQRVTGTGTCTECGCHAQELYPVWRDGSELLLCANCKEGVKR